MEIDGTRAIGPQPIENRRRRRLCPQFGHQAESSARGGENKRQTNTRG